MPTGKEKLKWKWICTICYNTTLTQTRPCTGCLFAISHPRAILWPSYKTTESTQEVLSSWRFQVWVESRLQGKHKGKTDLE